jgi:hypothetical protein
MTFIGYFAIMISILQGEFFELLPAGALCMSLGVAMFATVPVDELTFEDVVNNYVAIRVILCTFLWIFAFLFTLISLIVWIQFHQYYGGLFYMPFMVPFILLSFQFGCCTCNCFSRHWRQSCHIDFDFSENILRDFPALGDLNFSEKINCVIFPYLER